MARHPIRFGIQTGQQNVAWSDMLELWRKGDAWGYDSLWNFDHFFPIFVDLERDFDRVDIGGDSRNRGHALRIAAHKLKLPVSHARLNGL